METKSERLRHFAVNESETLVVFAEKLGIVPQQLQPYVSGKRFPKDDLLEKIAALGCNLHWLVTGEGSMYANNEAGKALRKKSQGIGKEHEPELLGHLSDMPGVNQRIINLDDSEVEILESLVNKIKGQTNANPKGT